jgi:hypothetical protein
MKYCHDTFSGYKAMLCAPETTVVGHRCTYEGRLPDEPRITKILNWGPCYNLSDVRAFLGTIGVCCMFIRNFAHWANALTIFTRKDWPFIFGPEQLTAQEDLKQALVDSPTIRAINYKSDSPVILAVDTSHIAVSYHLCQCDPDDPKKRHYARFGSITLNDRESHFSQPKLELYGLYRSFCALKLWLIGIRNLVVEVDVRYIKGMLSNPDLSPGASINRWILLILTFHFILVHIPGTMHGPDGLLWRRPQPGDILDPNDKDFDDWIDDLYGFMHMINASPPLATHLTNLAIFVLDVADMKSTPTSNIPLSYTDVPRLLKAQLDDTCVDRVRQWLDTLAWPADITDSEFAAFMRYAVRFFLHAGKLWRKDDHGKHKLVATQSARLAILWMAHNDLAHKGFFATAALISERFWWPAMWADIVWFIKTCRPCQLHQTRNVLIPPVIVIPASLFAKVYVDTMHLPKSNGYKYLIQGQCSLVHYVEFCKLCSETAITLGDNWLFEDILCRWGTIS